MPRIVMLATRSTLFWALLILPFFFGGVHPISYLSLALIIGLTMLMISSTCYRNIPDWGRLSLSHYTGMVCASLLTWISIILLQIFVFRFFTEPHPVLGVVSPWVNLSGASTGIVLILAFVALFAIARFMVATNAHSADFIENLIILSGGLVTFVALGHWFYDSGSLFGTFAPENVFVSHRARWPFVNSNSLGHFLLAPLFLTVCRLQELAVTWRDSIRLPERLGRREIKQLVLHRTSRRHAPSIAILSVLLIAMLIAIAGTLSRGSWLGLAMGGAVLYLMHFRVHRISIPVLQGTHSRKRRSRPIVALTERLSEGIPWFFSRLVPPLVICLALVFFLAGRGLDLVESRVEYSLLASKDDLRWILYSDSWRMLLQSPFLGVGFSNWLALYSRFASPALAGLNPEFLHSDPMQLLVEMGILGTLPLLVLASVLLRAFYGIRGTDRDSRRSRFLICSLIAVVTASFLDFPFRIPAISMQVAVTLALTSFYLDKLYLLEHSARLTVSVDSADNSGVESGPAVILSS